MKRATDFERMYRSMYREERRRAESYRTAFLVSLLAVAILLWPWLDVLFTEVFA